MVLQEHSIGVVFVQTNCPQYATQPYHETLHLQVQNSWPEKGRVEFMGAVLAYQPGLPNALDGVNLEVLPGERVGIVGRTGSGKSSLFLALFRMVELNQGQILLDGVDISSVRLSNLRSKLAIIPQDPFLFSSSVPENLDPHGLHPDFHFGERGKSVSVGGAQGHLSRGIEGGRERHNFPWQLLCLARALLTEANLKYLSRTSLLPYKPHQSFLSHRLNTIMDSDRVLVMHAGKMEEFDSLLLCAKEKTLFSRNSYVEGKTEFKILYFQLRM
uniref:ABC transporter domain-containing protein n=1 Tax=Sinocyclocheilus grahami TaxID=75366 RepID=A0A672SII6_SINGR